MVVDFVKNDCRCFVTRLQVLRKTLLYETNMESMVIIDKLELSRAHTPCAMAPVSSSVGYLAFW